MRNLNRSAYTYRRFRSQNKAKNEAVKETASSQEGGEIDLQPSLNQFPDKSWLDTYLGALPYGVLLVGKKGEVLFANTAFGSICTCNINDPGFIGMDVQRLLVKLGVEPGKKETCIPPGEIKSGDGRIIACSAHPLDYSRMEASPAVEMWLFKDITEERIAADQLVYMAEHDMLTGLHNRRRFQEELSHQIMAASRNKNPLALLFIDLDNFKIINDSMGHRAGDELLKGVAQRIASQVRGNEFVARIGGDEFAVLVPSANDLAIRSLSNRIRAAVSGMQTEDFASGVQVSCSIGVAQYPSDALTEKDLMAQADAAMYQSKANRQLDWRPKEKSGTQN